MTAKVLGCARHTVRLVAEESPGERGERRLDLGRLVTNVPRPEHNGLPLELVALVDLDSLAPRPASLAGIRQGRLMMFFHDVSDSCRLLHQHASSRVILAEKSQNQPLGASILPLTPGGTRLRLAPELALPRVWSDPVQALNLTDVELGLWEKLRERLAAVQGTMLADLLPNDPEVHRLFGYPDERTGDMQLICELGARGYDVADQFAVYDLATEDARSCSDRWRLLAQFEIGRAVREVNWRRLYYWVDKDDLDCGQFAHVSTVAR
jgi:hypothetical protein